MSWDDLRPDAGMRLQQELVARRQSHGPVQLAVNLDGFNPVTCALVPWVQPTFVAGGSPSANLRRQLPLGVLPVADPAFAAPDLLIQCTTARSVKRWPFSSWRRVVNHATSRGWSVGLVGSPPAALREAYNAGDGEEGLLAATSLLDLRCRTSLMHLAGAAQKARAVISVDAGPLHIAAAVGTPTLAVVGNDDEGVGLVRFAFGCPVARM